MAQVSSISRVGTTEPFELQISRGQIPFHKTIFKFDFNVSSSMEFIYIENDGAT